MLTPFPNLLTYSFFAPTILRVFAAGVIFMMAHVHRVHRHDLKKQLHGLLGGNAGYIVWAAIILEAAVGLGLFFGIYTQWAALLGAILAARSLLLIPHRALSPFDRSTDALLLAICLSLLLTGAGALAFDLPL